MKKIFLISMMLIFNSCCSQSKKIIEKRTIEVVLNSVGKTTINKKLISKLTGINESDLTTNVYFYSIGLRVLI